MQTKELKLLTTLLLLLPLCVVLLGAGCDDDDISQSVLNGKWILIGFGDDSTNEFASEPDSEPESSYLLFNDGEMVAYSVTNRTFDMKYFIEEGNKLSVTSGKMTLIGGDTEWGQQFLTLLGKTFGFELTEDVLRLYYEDQKFMKLEKEIK